MKIVNVASAMPGVSIVVCADLVQKSKNANISPKPVSTQIQVYSVELALLPTRRLVDTMSVLKYWRSGEILVELPMLDRFPRYFLEERYLFFDEITT